MGKQFRQGDLLIEEVESLPKDLLKVSPEDGRLILARGEATGHHHELVGDGVELFEKERDEVDDRYITVSTPLAELEHDEHDTIEIPRGDYHVTRQREYQEKAPPRPVYD